MKKHNRLGILFMVLGALLVAAAIALSLWNTYEDKRAGEAAEDALQRIEEKIELNRLNEGGLDAPLIPDPYQKEMKEVDIDGHLYIGYLSIPSLDLRLPVMTNWSYPQLRISPCRYTGTVQNDDLVIAGHNYRRHFNRLKELKPGDKVYFTDMDGVVTKYEVIEMEIVDPTSIENMLNGNYDQTMFTCTYGGKSRVAVRCARTKTAL